VIEVKERQSCLFVSIKTAVSNVPRQIRKFSKQNDIFMERQFTIAT